MTVSRAGAPSLDQLVGGDPAKVKARIYTTGYRRRGWTVEDLHWAVGWLDVRVLDIRSSPYCGKEWHFENLERVLSPRFWHVPDLGNPAHREGRIEVRDLRTGTARACHHAERSPGGVLLLCACANPQKCHRSVVAAAVAKALRTTFWVELGPPKGRRPGDTSVSQMTLL